MIHLGVWLVLFGGGLLIWQRPVFASSLNVLGMLLIVLVSNAKFASLREPFLLADFRFFKALLRHPRLYLPFFGVLPAIVFAIAFACLGIFALRIEPSLWSQIGLVPLLVGCLILICLGAGLLRIGSRHNLPITLDPARDLQALGLVGSLVAYWQAEQRDPARKVAANLPDSFYLRTDTTDSPCLPHIVAVQCESFFDARRVVKDVSSDVLTHFDALTKISSRAGRLQVPAWGANTVRTEFAFLSGIAPPALGIHRFNPYRHLARHAVPTLASELKKQGYHTICVHPFSAKFYDRDKVFPVLGFDEFIDVTAFSPADKCGAYISDAVVAEKVSTILGAATAPLFIFVITMENHGPLHQERVTDGDVARLYACPPPPGYDEFTIYLRHLQHTDAMLGVLYAALRANKREGWLCAYGDHVPILPGVYAANKFVDGRTDYFIVGTNTTDSIPCRQDLAPEDLAACLLRQAGF